MPIMMIFAVVVIALIVVAGIFAGQQLLSGGNLSTAQTQIGNITAKVQALYGSQASYLGLDTAGAVKAGIFPQNMVNGTGAVSPFGGSVEVFDAGLDGNNLYTAGQAFAVQYDALTDKDCVALATSITAHETYITVNQYGTAMGTANPANPTPGQAVTPAQAEQYCNNGADTVAFLFTKSSS